MCVCWELDLMLKFMGEKHYIILIDTKASFLVCTQKFDQMGFFMFKLLTHFLLHSDLIKYVSM